MTRSAERQVVATRIHGHIEVAVPEGEGPWPLLVGFHGYGERASDHMAELQKLPGSERWILCAVQGLHLFYRKTGDVVASWMTKVGREQAIEDNVAYVRTVVETVTEQHSCSETLVYAGFSQGVAMAYRAAAASARPCSGLIVLAGDVPPEITGPVAEGLPPVLVGRGVDDSWYTEAKMQSDLDRLAEAGVTATRCVFEGGHVWTDPFRTAAGQHLAAAQGTG